MGKELFHQHLLIRAYVKTPPRQEEVLNNWLTSLVEAIKMKVVVPARSAYVTKPGNEGLTGSVNIETSHCAIHIWDNLPVPKLEMDVYSCDCFELETVLQKLREFGLIKYHYMMIDRNHVPFEVVGEGASLEDAQYCNENGIKSWEL